MWARSSSSWLRAAGSQHAGAASAAAASSTLGLQGSCGFHSGSAAPRRALAAARAPVNAPSCCALLAACKRPSSLLHARASAVSLATPSSNASTAFGSSVRHHYSATTSEDDEDYDDDDGSHDGESTPPTDAEHVEKLRLAKSDAHGARIAMEIFKEIEAAGGQGLTGNVASGLIEVLGAKNDVAGCLEVLKYSREQSVRPRIHAYSSVIACCYHEQKYTHALQVFEVMRNDGYLPKLVTYSRALSAAFKSNQHELVLEIFDDMMRHKVETSIVIYNNILNSCARVGDGQSAMGVLRAIQQRELEPTQSTYHSLAICAGKTGLWELALDVLQNLKESGFEPTMTIYNSVLSACAKGKRWDDVVSVYAEMPQESRDQLTGLYLGAALMGHAKSNDNEVRLQAIEIYEEHKSKNEEDLNLFGYNAALVALLETNQLEEVHKVANDIKRRGLKWDTLTYQCVLLAYTRGGAIDTAVHMLRTKAKHMQQSTPCYRELIQYYAEKRKDPREACRLTMQMMQNNARLSRLDWHNALGHALQVQDRALYWNFRKWMKVRAPRLVEGMPKHLMLADYSTLQKKHSAKVEKQQNKHKQQQQQNQNQPPRKQEDKLL